jgi:CRISPR-associated protein Cas5h
MENRLKYCYKHRIRSEWGSFKYPFANVSSSTYYVVPPTYVKGMMGGILGFSREMCYDLTKEWKIGIRINKEFSIDNTSFNGISLKTKDGRDNFRKPISIGILRHLDYTIFVCSPEEIDFLKELVYFPYMGKNSFFVVHDFLGEVNIEEVDKVEDFSTRCVLLSDSVKIDMTDCEDLNIYQQIIPVDGNWITTYKKNKRVVFTSGDKSLAIKSAEKVVKIEDDYMHLL